MKIVISMGIKRLLHVRSEFWSFYRERNSLNAIKINRDVCCFVFVTRLI